jgi:hypothetical protein
MSHKAEYTCCSSVALERPNEHAFTFTCTLLCVHRRYHQGAKHPLARGLVLQLVDANVAVDTLTMLDRFHRHFFQARIPYSH